MNSMKEDKSIPQKNTSQKKKANDPQEFFRGKKIERKTHEIDLSGQVLGRAASHVALLLSGKRKVSFTWNVDGGDYVRAYNLEKIKISGKDKPDTKIYYHYTGYPGGIKGISLRDAMAKDPQKVFRQAVLRMLPKNKLRSRMIKRLELIEGEMQQVSSK